MASEKVSWVVGFHLGQAAELEVPLVEVATDDDLGRALEEMLSEEFHFAEGGRDLIRRKVDGGDDAGWIPEDELGGDHVAGPQLWCDSLQVVASGYDGHTAAALNLRRAD